MNSPDSVIKLRAASKNEKRYIVRHALDWYRALIIAGLYTVTENEVPFDTTCIHSYMPALKWCIDAHPILSTALQGEDSEAPDLIRPEKLDLRDHIKVIDPKLYSHATSDETALLKQVILEIHDQPWSKEAIPPWKIVVLPLPDQADGLEKRVCIIYAYSHTHGDGKSGLAFHRSFLQGLRAAPPKYDQSLIYRPSLSSLPPPLEEACDLKISWSYLLSPLLGEYLPGFLGRWLNLQSTATPQSTNTYIGKPTSHDPNNFHTGSQILVVKKDLLDGVLTACRSQRAKLTGLLNQLVVRAMCEAFSPDAGYDNFIGQIVIDLRALIPDYSDDTMGNCISAVYEVSPRADRKSGEFRYDDAFWDAVRATTSRLAESANRLDDQPVGLLKYLGNFRSWFLQKLGKDRDSSYEISNVGVFDPSDRSNASASVSQQSQSTWSIEKMIFSQPANVTASPLNFQVVTMKGADMVITLNWQLGVLGVDNEEEFTKIILGRINDFLQAIASGSA